MQQLGIVVFAAIMGTVCIQIMLQGLATILSQDSVPALPPLDKEIEFKSLLVIIVMVSNIVIKFSLWIYCRLFRNEIVKVHRAHIKLLRFVSVKNISCIEILFLLQSSCDLLAHRFQAYADDHGNDVVLNSASILGALLAANFEW